MKKILVLFCLLFILPVLAQDHFSGITTSKRVGIINIGMNPSELANLSSKFEVQALAASINISNNKVGFTDIINGDNLENKIFKGDGPVNFKVDAEFYGPGIAAKLLGWGFAISSKGHVKANIIDVDPSLGDAFSNSLLNSISNSSIISNNYNQRVNTTSWGEIGFSVAHQLFQNKNSSLNGGLTLKLLFPGSYANIGAGNFNGTVSTSILGNAELTNANANLNIAYTGNFANSFANTGDYTQSVFGNLNGMAADIGFDYQLKSSGSGYKLKIGAALKNMGSMTFKSNDNYSKDYKLEIQNSESLNLNQFENAGGIKDIENILLESGYVTLINNKKDFKVKLPTVLNLYADFKVIPKVNLTLFLQQKMNKDSENSQITSQNIFSISPRVSLGFFEAYLPVSFNEVSGTTAGAGFRLSGFFLGSNSILTAITSNSKQADLYMGYRIGFL
jgi:hypothetical protein